MVPLASELCTGSVQLTVTSVWGNSLSYLNSKATGGSSSPQVLDEIYIPSNKEFAIYSDRECKDGSCGYARPGSVAYRE